MKRRRWIIAVALVQIGLAGGVWLPSGMGRLWRERPEPWGLPVAVAGAAMMGGMGHGGMMGCGPAGAQDFASNGERIYLSGVSDRIGPISRFGGPMWIRMMGGGCAACHGSDGHGGQPVMMGTAVPADIRYEALITGTYEPGEHATPYTEALIKRAVTQGLDADGKPLDTTMPRWQMTDADFADLLAYLRMLR